MSSSTLSQSAAAPKPLSILQVLACGAAIVTLSMGIRHGFGLWLQPVTQAQGWTRETFAFALAIQNLSWGIFGIFAGMAADRFGAFRVILGGSVLYALGLVGMALSPTGFLFTLTARSASTMMAGAFRSACILKKKHLWSNWCLPACTPVASLTRAKAGPTVFQVACTGWA